jgi:hypothetical protein
VEIRFECWVSGVRDVAGPVLSCASLDDQRQRTPSLGGRLKFYTQAMLGFLPDAPRKKLFVDPSLPIWMRDLTMYDLRVGKHKIDIRFWREGEQTAFEVIKGDPNLVERCHMAFTRRMLGRTWIDSNRGGVARQGQCTVRSTSTKLSGTRNWAFTPMHSMARRRRC